jgi:predicted nucleic acid-binding protein
MKDKIFLDNFQYYDSLIVAIALENECNILYSMGYAPHEEIKTVEVL